jgi:hypothetical protein
MLRTFHKNVVNIVGLSNTEFHTDLKGSPYDGKLNNGYQRPKIEGVISLWEDLSEEEISLRLGELKRIHQTADLTAYVNGVKYVGSYSGEI